MLILILIQSIGLALITQHKEGRDLFFYENVSTGASVLIWFIIITFVPPKRKGDK